MATIDKQTQDDLKELVWERARVEYRGHCRRMGRAINRASDRQMDCAFDPENYGVMEESMRRKVRGVAKRLASSDNDVVDAMLPTFFGVLQQQGHGETNVGEFTDAFCDLLSKNYDK